MGFCDVNQDFEHVPPNVASKYFMDFWSNIYKTGAMWHRYVYAEHVKFIAEYTPQCQLFFGRSIFRSLQAYADESELDKDWWIGYVGQFNSDKSQINIISSMPTLTAEEYRKLYHQCKGTGDF